jgi:hypothetical protein
VDCATAGSIVLAFGRSAATAVGRTGSSFGAVASVALNLGALAATSAAWPAVAGAASANTVTAGCGMPPGAGCGVTAGVAAAPKVGAGAVVITAPGVNGCRHGIDREHRWRWDICRFGVARRFGVIAGLWLLAELGVRLRLVVVGNFTWSRGRIGRGRIRDIGSIGSVGAAGRIGGTGGLRFAGGLCCLGAIVLRRGLGQIRLRRCRGLAGGSRRQLRRLRGWSLRAVVEQAVERRFARARGTLRRVCLMRRRRLIGAGSRFGRNLGHGNLRISGV